MLFLSFFKTLQDKTVTLELKNDFLLEGKLVSVDPYLNFRLENVKLVSQGHDYPQLKSLSSMLLRGSTVRYVHINSADTDVSLLQDASLREANRISSENDQK